jgi:hypothetical protein
MQTPRGGDAREFASSLRASTVGCFSAPPPDRRLGRLVMMMHVMFVGINVMDKWRDHDCNVVYEVVRVDIPLMYDLLSEIPCNPL